MINHIKNLNNILPSFPRTSHLPGSNNSDNDIIAEAKEISSIFTHEVSLEEKIDGASVGMGLYEKEPVIRNRDHILRKGYTKNTSAKKQFVSIWNWFYENKSKFTKLGEPYVIYGEWMVAAHGILYDKLPDWFIAYDIFNYKEKNFLPTPVARQILLSLGFNVPKQYFCGKLEPDAIYSYLNQKAEWSDELAEGIYVKMFDSKQILNRFKLVRQDFERGKYWNSKVITKNSRNRGGAAQLPAATGYVSHPHSSTSDSA